MWRGCDCKTTSVSSPVQMPSLRSRLWGKRFPEIYGWTRILPSSEWVETDVSMLRNSHPSSCAFANFFQMYIPLSIVTIVLQSQTSQVPASLASGVPTLSRKGLWISLQGIFRWERPSIILQGVNLPASKQSLKVFPTVFPRVTEDVQLRVFWTHHLSSAA